MVRDSSSGRAATAATSAGIRCCEV
jgi:hypothetical protein